MFLNVQAVLSYGKAADVVRLIVRDCINVVCAGEAVQTDIGLSHFIDVDHPCFRPDQSPRVKFLPAKDNNIVFSYARLSDSTIRAHKLLSYTSLPPFSLSNFMWIARMSATKILWGQILPVFLF